MRSDLPAKYDPFLLMDRLDDEAIIAELQGQTIKALVYQFRQGKQLVTGLSKAGVDAVCREMAKQGEVIREIELNVVDTGTEYVAHVKAGRYVIQVNQQTGEVKEVLLDTVFGVKRQPKNYEDGKPNPFAYEQAVSKAARNARMRLLREDLKQAIIALAVKEGRTITVASPEAEQANGAPTNGDRDKKAVFAEIGKLSKEYDKELVGEAMRNVIQHKFGVRSRAELEAHHWKALREELVAFIEEVRNECKSLLALGQITEHEAGATA